MQPHRRITGRQTRDTRPENKGTGDEIENQALHTALVLVSQIFFS